MKNNLSFAFLIISIISLISCATNGFQTANTLPKGDWAVTVGSALAISPAKDSDETNFLPLPMVSVRRGFTDSIDAGLQTYHVTGLYGDIKYSPYQNRQEGLSVALALGGGFAYLGDKTRDYSYKLDATGFFSYMINDFITPYSLLRFSRYKLDGFRNPDEDDWFGDIGYADCYYFEAGAGVHLFQRSWVSIFVEGGRLINIHGDDGENIGKSWLLALGVQFKL